ncbi:MAG: HAMP domain-containing protein [Alphaproteobacteria bacterium]|nr:HAMP domain-containing protein [Alphaproteobacteria bacterium]
MSITKKIFAITFCVASLAVAAITVTTLALGTEALRDLGRRRLVEGVAREADILQSRGDALRDDITSLAKQDAVRLLSEAGGAAATEVTAEAAVSQLRMIMEKRPAYIELAVVQAELQLRVRREADGLMVDVRREPRPTGGEEPLLAQLAASWPGAVEVSAVARVAAARDPWAPAMQVIHAGTRLPGGRQTLILLTVDLDTLVGDIGGRGDTGLFVVDRSGDYLTRQPDARRKAPNLLDDYGLRPTWSPWLAQHDPRYYAEVSGGGLALALRRVVLGDPMSPEGARHLVVGGIASLADIESEVKALRTQLAALSLGLGGFLAITLALATAHLMRPLSALTQVAERIAAGQREVTFPALPADEIGRLAEVMQRMLDALRLAAKTEEQATLGRMATMIAHDVRNALSSVKMNLQILAEDGQENCAIALKQITYMESLLDDMLAFAQPDDLRLDWIDIGDAIHTALVSMLPEINHKAIQLINGDGLSAAKLPKVLGDRTKLIRALQNVVANAVQAVSNGGTLTVTAYPVLFESMPAVAVVIADDGEGVPAAVADRVFEPFFTTRAKGTGLGLAIVQRILRAHGGTVELMPRQGGGTDARLVLPVTPPESCDMEPRGSWRSVDRGTRRLGY